MLFQVIMIEYLQEEAIRGEVNAQKFDGGRGAWGEGKDKVTIQQAR